MAERLTTRFHGILVKEADVSKIQVITKLGQLEDILEKYGIESAEELEKEMHSLMLIISILNDYGIEDYNELDEILKEFSYMKKMETEIGKELKFYKTDRDTWKRACEFLAYEYAEEYFDGRDIEHCFNADKRDKFVKENINRFYQQAKNMEGNDE